MSWEPTILVTNDDGITAPGIRNLIDAVRHLGKVIVVAPDSPQSGMGHAVSIEKTLRLNKVTLFEEWPNVEAYQCSGTPVDCVKMANDVILKGKRPTICVSGINHGSNASINVIYSGTMSAAMEAAIDGIPAVGFSNLDYAYDADFSIAKSVATDIVTRMLAEDYPTHFLLNVNIPKVNKEDFKGIKVCRQADAFWAENFDHRTDPRGRNYYWMVGKFVNRDQGMDTDIQALRDGYASVVPVRIDFTDEQIKSWLEKKWN